MTSLSRPFQKNANTLILIITSALLIGECIVWISRPASVVSADVVVHEKPPSPEMDLRERLSEILPKKYGQLHKDLIDGYSIEVWSSPGESQKIVAICDSNGDCIDDVLGETRFYNENSGRMLRVTGKTNDIDGLNLEIKRPIVTSKGGILFREEVTRYDTKWLGGVFRVVDGDWPERVKIVVGVGSGKQLTTAFDSRIKAGK